MFLDFKTRCKLPNLSQTTEGGVSQYQLTSVYFTRTHVCIYIYIYIYHQ